MSEQTKNLVPLRRFPEFDGTDQWDIKRLDDLYVFKVTNSLSRDNLNYLNGKVKNIHYGDIHTKFSTLFDLQKERVPFINPSESLEKIKQDSYCKAGDMVFADASEDLADIGKAIEIVNLNNEKLLSGLHTLLARQKEEKLIIGFGGHLFKSNHIRKQIQKESQGAKVLGISAGRLSAIKICYPSEKKEQQKIADCLSSIDKLISAQTQKIAELKDLKKGLMQQLFPAQGETVPKLRFPEFKSAGEWKFIPMSMLAKRCKQKNQNLKIKKVLTNSAEFGVLDQRDYFDKDIATQGNLEGYYIVEKGDYVYNPRISSMAPVGPISKNNVETGVMSPLYTVFRFDSPHNDFYALFFKTTGWHDYMRKVASTGARHDRMAITNDDFMGMPLPVTSNDEQQKIADCLSSLDDLINEQVQKFEVYKSHKKGLMQQLFPNLSEVGE